jgi:hypothetical protein
MFSGILAQSSDAARVGASVGFSAELRFVGSEPNAHLPFPGLYGDPNTVKVVPGPSGSLSRTVVDS